MKFPKNYTSKPRNCPHKEPLRNAIVAARKTTSTSVIEIHGKEEDSDTIGASSSSPWTGVFVSSVDGAETATLKELDR